MKKELIRKTYKAKRKEMSESERNSMSTEISLQLAYNVDLTDKNISVFLPIERFKEIDTWKIIDSVPATYVVPVIKGKQLQHIILDSKDQLEISDFGIPEPTYGEELRPDQLDIVLVPLLAFDKVGNRVGYGAGFYDGFLSQCRKDCLFVGLSYFDPIDLIEDAYERDVKLHHCVSPNSFFSF